MKIASLTFSGVGSTSLVAPRSASSAVAKYRKTGFFADWWSVAQKPTCFTNYGAPSPSECSVLVVRQSPSGPACRVVICVTSAIKGNDAGAPSRLVFSRSGEAGALICACGANLRLFHSHLRRAAVSRSAVKCACVVWCSRSGNTSPAPSFSSFALRAAL